MAQTGGGSNGIANALTAAGNGGFIAVPPTYTGTDPAGFTNYNGSVVQDQRGGSNIMHYSNPLNGIAGQKNCADTKNLLGVQSATYDCDSTNAFCVGFGSAIGDGFNPNCTAMGLVFWDYSKGIQGAGVKQINCNHDNDCNNLIYAWCGGWDLDPDREGPCEFPTPAHISEFTEVFTSPIANFIDSTHFFGSRGSEGQYNGGVVINLDDVKESGHLLVQTGDTPPLGTVTTDQTHAVSNYGTINAAIGNPAEPIHGSPATVTVTMTNGTPPSSGNACLSDNGGNYWQEATFTASGTTVTFNNLIYPFAAHSPVGFGSCLYLRATSAMQTNGFGTTQSDLVYPIIYFPSSNTAAFFSQNFSYGIATKGETAETLPLILDTVTAVRDTSNNVTMVLNPIRVQSDNFYAPVSPVVAAASCADPSFNFGASTVTSTLDPDQATLHYVQPEGPGTSASTTACVLTISGNNLYQIVSGAQVISVTDPATFGTGGSPLDGYYEVLPNTAFTSAHNGTNFEQPHAPRINMDNLSSIQQWTPGGAQMFHWQINEVGSTVNQEIHPFIFLDNQVAPSSYVGLGGLWQPGNAMKIGGVWENMFITSNPVNGGAELTILCENQCNSSQPFQVINFAGFPGSASLQFTPSSGLLHYNGPTLISTLEVNPFSNTLDPACTTPANRLCIVGSGSGIGTNGFTIFGGNTDGVAGTYTTPINTWNVGSGAGGTNSGDFYFLNSATHHNSFSIDADDTVHLRYKATFDYLTGPSQLCIDNTSSAISCSVIHGSTALTAGAATVSAPSIVSGNLVFLQNCGGTSTAIGTLKVASITTGTGFTIQSVDATNTVVTGDTSNVCYSVQ